MTIAWPLVLLALISSKPQSNHQISGSQQPANPYIAHGACPFECCTYRTWWPDKTISLYDKPRGSRVIATVRSGEHVRAITGEVIVTPTRYVLTRDEIAYVGPSKTLTVPLGAEIWLLDYEGEGHIRAWWKGRVLDLDLSDSSTGGSDITRIRAIIDHAREQSVWWAKIRSRSGRVGWTRETNLFNNQDACG